MCTIGNSFYQSGRYTVNSLFKQCDLVDATVFLPPKLETSRTTGVKYVAMTRKKPDGSAPAWAGVNSCGVSFVAADAYMGDGFVQMEGSSSDDGVSIFDMYLKTITDFRTAKDAANFACNYYKNTFKEPDIFMVGDATASYFIEAANGVVKCIERTKGFFASTNHFRMIYGAVPYEKNHSTYLRLQRAESILQNKPDLDGIGDVLRDDYFGKTVWSICRYPEHTGVPQEQTYYTQAAVIFSIAHIGTGTPTIVCEYVINGNPSEKGKGYMWVPFTGNPAEAVDYIGKNGHLPMFLENLE